jgi:hypothetical protein
MTQAEHGKLPAVGTSVMTVREAVVELQDLYKELSKFV